MSWRNASIPALILTLLAPLAAEAADKTNPDWPCVQRKVENITASQVWAGPSLDGLPDWRDDEKIASLAKKLSSRRESIDAAKASVEAFAKAEPESARNARLTLLFAGIFDTLTSERRIIVSGIEKYNRRQKERALIVEEKGKHIAELEAQGISDDKAAEELAKLQEDYDWETRVFKERNDNIPIACELPVLIDQRLFELGSAIQSHMKS